MTSPSPIPALAARPLRRAILTIAVFALVAPAPACAQRRDTLALVAPAGALSFLVIGDWGWASAPQYRVAGAMAKAATALGVSFVVSTGDNFYPAGVKSADDPQWRRTFENVYSMPSLKVDWYPVLGNHDYYQNPQAEIEYSARSDRWRMPARYYTVTKTVAPGVTVEFFFLDTSPFVPESYGLPSRKEVEKVDTVAQRRWLDSTLAASTAQWKFVVGHNHVYTGGPRNTTYELERLLVERMERAGVQAYFAGHEHHLEHIVPEGSPMHYFISGAGSETREARGREGSRFFSSALGFLAMSVTPDSTVAQIVDGYGRLLYRTSLRR